MHSFFNTLVSGIITTIPDCYPVLDDDDAFMSAVVDHGEGRGLTAFDLVIIGSAPGPRLLVTSHAQQVADIPLGYAIEDDAWCSSDMRDASRTRRIARRLSEALGRKLPLRPDPGMRHEVYMLLGAITATCADLGMRPGASPRTDGDELVVTYCDQVVLRGRVADTTGAAALELDWPDGVAVDPGRSVRDEAEAITSRLREACAAIDRARTGRELVGHCAMYGTSTHGEDYAWWAKLADGAGETLSAEAAADGRPGIRTAQIAARLVAEIARAYPEDDFALWREEGGTAASVSRLGECAEDLRRFAGNRDLAVVAAHKTAEVALRLIQDLIDLGTVRAASKGFAARRNVNA